MIDSTTTIDRVEIRFVTDNIYDATVVAVKNGPVLASWRPPYDITDAEFQEVKSRIEAGTIRTWYFVSGIKYTDIDDIPQNLRPLVDGMANPFNRSVTGNQEVDDLGPYNEFWYKRAASAPSLPSFDDFDNDDHTSQSIMEAAGWSRSFPAGTDALYHSVITWSVVDGEASIEGTPPRTDDIRYSTDNGETFTSTPPSDLDDVDMIEVFYAGIGWVRHGLRETEQENPLVAWPGDNWQNGGSGDNQKVSIPSGLNLKRDAYKFGGLISQLISWSNTAPRRAGSFEIPVFRLRFTTPGEFAGAEDEQIDGKTYIIVQDDDIGSVRVGVKDPDIDLSDFSTSDYASWLMHLMLYPRTTLTSAVATDAMSIYVASAADMAIGNTLFLGSEKMDVAAIDTTPDSTQGNGYRVGVVRAQHGTVARAHNNGATVRAIVNEDAVNYVLLNQRSGPPASTTVHFYHLKQRNLEAT